MAGHERNHFRTAEAFRQVVDAILEAHPEIATQKALAANLGIAERTISRALVRFGIDWNSLADWPTRRERARLLGTPEPSRWMFCHVIVANTLEEALARFRTDYSATAEIASITRQ
jgi:hypothetical protein